MEYPCTVSIKISKHSKYKKSLLSFVGDFLGILLTFFTVYLIINMFLGQLLVVVGDSMYPTIKNGEQILGEKLSLNFSDIKRGEIVIFRVFPSRKLLVKRIVALPGESVLIKKGRVYINGKELVENYINGEITESGKFFVEGEPKEVPKGQYFLLGDNRDQSLDSREWGFIPKENVESRARLVYFPLKNLRILK